MATEAIPKLIDECEYELSGLCLKLDDLLNYIYSGFIKHNKNELNKARNLHNELERSIKSLTVKIENSNLNEIKCKKSIILSVPSHLERINSNANILIEAVEKKILQSLLFSEKATNELKHLYKSVSELLKDISDGIKTKNQTLLNHIIKQSDVLIKKTDNYATEHEERLIKGLCTLKASPIYLDILDSFKGIIWHTSQVAQRVYS